MKQSFEHAWACARRYGGTHAMWCALHRVRAVSVHHALDFHVQRADAALQEWVGPSGGARDGKRRLPLVCREISADELSGLTYAHGLRYPQGPLLESLRQQMRNGLRFCAAFHHGRVIAVNGFHTSRAHLSYLRLPAVPLAPGTVYLNGALTAPAYRRQGVGSALRGFLISLARREGCRNILAATRLARHEEADRWHRALGSAQWGRLTYLCVGGVEVWLRHLTAVGRRSPDLLTGVTQPVWCRFPEKSRMNTMNTV